MLERDTDLLDALLDDEYTLTHLTGYLQSKREWLEQIDSGEMEYCSSLERGTSVEVTGDTAVLVGKMSSTPRSGAAAAPGTCSSPPPISVVTASDCAEDGRHHLLTPKSRPSMGRCVERRA